MQYLQFHIFFCQVTYNIKLANVSTLQIYMTKQKKEEFLTETVVFGDSYNGSQW